MKNVILILLVTGITCPTFSQTLKRTLPDTTLEFSLIFKKSFSYEHVEYFTPGFTNSQFLTLNFDLSIGGKSKIITMSHDQITSNNNYLGRKPCVKPRYYSKIPCLTPEFISYMPVYNSHPNWEYYLIMDIK